MLRTVIAGMVLVAGLILCGGFAGTAPQTTAQRIEKAGNYETRTIAGFTVHVHHDLLADEELTRRVMLHLEADLDEIAHMVPSPALGLLTQAHIWAELQGMSTTANAGHGLCCHWSPGWLKANGVLAEKVGGVEIINPGDFLNWRRDQPYMLFHELAHAIHWRLAKLDPEIDAAFAQAMKAKLYDAVARNTVPGGETVKAYAATNSHEYFAELSEAYFAVNDFFPYTRGQLAKHDPRGLAMIERVWNLSAEELEAGRGARP